ncbi:MAG: hypothetical protein JO217_15930 [Acidobacteriaceae bacterium]|nr:hypothetical protein [Acidobacteriaceae bacterium]
MNIVSHDPKGFMIMGIGQAAGLLAVPDDMFIRNMLAVFISTMFIIGMSIAGMFIG